eukprot:jgi/Hompol1/4071/HPOL_000902-RA
MERKNSCCIGAAEARIPREIDRQLSLDKRQFERLEKEPRVLILGSADCGKSTLIKQFRIAYTQGFSDVERKTYRRQILMNLVDNIRALVIAADKFGTTYDSETNEQYRNVVMDFRLPDGLDARIPKNVTEAIEALWKDSAIQDAWKVANVARFTSETFEPNNDDILHTRLPTDTVSETVMTINSKRFHFFDVGGLVKQRKHWTPYFDQVHCIMFVASLSSYDQRLLEDPTVNRMADALALFDQTINNELLKDITVILFLNKKDLFKSKLATNPIAKYFPDCVGIEKYDHACKYFAKKFTAMNGSDSRPLLVHFTRATDTNGMNVVLKASM